MDNDDIDVSTEELSSRMHKLLGNFSYTLTPEAVKAAHRILDEYASAKQPSQEDLLQRAYGLIMAMAAVLRGRERTETDENDIQGCVMLAEHVRAERDDAVAERDRLIAEVRQCAEECERFGVSILATDSLRAIADRGGKLQDQG